MRGATGKPVLFAISGDPVELGIAESLARPGRNFTGTTFMSLDVAQKRVQLLKELLPDMGKLAILSQKNHAGEQSEHEATRAAADALSIHLAYVPFATRLRALCNRSGTRWRSATCRCSPVPTR
jgi:putative ABC transport system substrate-binding protein